jgi:DNA-directed RNA polymerase subunit beta'
MRPPHDILRVLGEKELQKYLVNESQEVYRLQGVNINDKHIEVISRQMMRWVRSEDVGDTEFLIDEQTDKFRFLEENERVIQGGGRPATAQPMLLGITKGRSRPTRSSRRRRSRRPHASSRKRRSPGRSITCAA